jgi:hypothetical protein
MTPPLKRANNNLKNRGLKRRGERAISGLITSVEAQSE